VTQGFLKTLDITERVTDNGVFNISSGRVGCCRVLCIVHGYIGELMIKELLKEMKEWISITCFFLTLTFYVSIVFIFLAAWYSAYCWAWSVFFGG